MIDIATADVLEWARTYDGPKFHAMVTDPPYHLHGGAGAGGFMNKQWDGGGVAFDPATWAALAEHLHPGAFIMAFASSRGWHRLAVAIEDAGLRIHPSIFGWAFGSGFPKATRVKDAPDFEGHRYGGQALKPAVEPIIVAQVPYAGRPRDSITATGAGAIWVDGGRVATGAQDAAAMQRVNTPGSGRFSTDMPPIGTFKRSTAHDPLDCAAGRWPPNLVLCHAPGCQRVGTRRVRGNGHYPPERTPNSIYGNGAGTNIETGWNDERVTTETVAAWDCAPECPVRRLGEQSGERASGAMQGAYMGPVDSVAMNNGLGMAPRNIQASTGTAARFFPNPDYSLDIAEAIAAADPVMYCAKASRRERNAGCEGMPERMPDNAIDRASQRAGLEGAPGRGSLSKPRANPHPTVKPLALARWLATLLLPPDAYAPRRLLVPFSGSGSEMIGAMLAGWEDVQGVEGEAEYVEIARARLAWWEANRDKAPEVRAGSGADHSARQTPSESPVYGRFTGRANANAPAPMLPGLEAAP